MKATANDETGALRTGLSPGAPTAPLTTLFTEQDTAALFKVTKKGLQGWRYRGGGPPFVKVGRCVRYRLEDLQAFVLAALRTSTSDPGPALPDRPGIRVAPSRDTMGRGRTPVSSASPPQARSLGEFRRVPTRRRHSLPRGRVRIRVVLPNQQVSESAPRPAR